MPGGYSIVISATDSASGVLDKANKRVEALNKRISDAQAPFKRLGENFDTFTKVTGLDKIATGFGDVARAGTESFRSLARVVEPLAAITGAVSVAGMWKLVEAWGAFATTLGQQASRANLSTDSLYNLQGAARLAGVSAEMLTQGMTTLGDNMRNAAFGGAPQFLVVLKNLGLSYEELKKQNPEQQIRTFADALARVQSPTDRALYAGTIFGGEGLLPLLAKSGQGIADLEARAKALTGGFSGPMAAAGNAFRESLEAVRLSIEGLGNSVASVLGPALAPLLGQVSGAVVGMRQWVDANQEWLRGEISQKVGEFVGWLKGVDWSHVGTEIHDLVVGAEHFASALLAWIPAGNSVLTYLGIAWLTGMLGPLATLLLAVTNLGIAIGQGLPKAFVLASLAAEQFSKRAMVLPVFRALALAVTLFDRASEGTPVEQLTPDQRRFLGVGEDNQPLPPEEQARRDNEPGLMGWWHRNMPSAIGGGYAPTSAPGANAPGGTTVPSPGGIGPNARYIHDAMIRDGYTEAQADGMLGHLRGESFRNGDFDPHAFNPDGGGQGAQSIGQWRGPRVDQFRAQYHHDPREGTIQEVTEYLLWELKNTERASGQTLRQETDPGQAAADMVRMFGRPFPQDLPGEQAERSRWGRGWARQFAPAGDPAPLPSAAPGAPGAPGSTGRVDLNVRVQGPAGSVVGRSQGDVDLNIQRPGVIDDFTAPAVPMWGR